MTSAFSILPCCLNGPLGHDTAFIAIVIEIDRNQQRMACLSEDVRGPLVLLFETAGHIIY